MKSQSTTPQPARSLALSRRSLLLQATAAGLAAPALATFGAPSLSAASMPSSAARASDSLTTSLDAVLAAAVKSGFPGIALQVEQAGKTLYSGAAGVSSIEQETPLKSTDRQRIYSIAKTFTAIVTLQLVDEGALSLDDTVTKWLDDPAVTRIPNVNQVTLRQLLVHTSGIYDFADDTDSPFWVDAFLGPNADWTKVWTLEELLAYADGANHAPYFAPGEGYHYSNTNYILVGLIVEKITGHKYGAELQTRILKPLALKDTFFAEGAEMPEDTIDAYQLVDGQLVSLSGTNLSWAWTFGGMVSTTDDLARFSRAVFGGGLLSRGTFEEMFDFVPADKPDKYEGMGVYKIKTPNGDLVGMDGSGPGANSSMMRLPRAALTVLVIDNMAPDEGGTDLVRDAAFKTVLGSA
jgi:D-alanyl-D-alanine carboxypeptidase